MTVREYINERDEIEFPEGKIVTLDGRVLDCFPITTGNAEIVDDSFKLDTTGRYLSIGRKPRTPFPPTPKEVEEQRDLFINNAFYLLAHKDRIMSDSRMFLCPVAIQSGIAYTGTSGFTRPTLGVYLEWWGLVPNAMQTDDKGHKLLVYHIAGSPLSGSNRCGAVRDDGEREIVSLSPFGVHWGPFTQINCRYNDAKYIYQAYTLQDVLDILDAEENGNSNYAQNVEMLYMSHEVELSNRRLEQEQARYSELQRKYADALFKYNEELICDFYAQYEGVKAKIDAEIEQLRKQKRDLKAELKSGRMDNVTYQKKLTPLKKHIMGLKYKISDYRYTKVRETFSHESDMTFDLIEHYVLNKRKEETNNKVEQ